MRWYKRLVAQKFDGSKERKKRGRLHADEEIEPLVIRMANDNFTWGYRRIQEVLKDLGHQIDEMRSGGKRL